MNLSIKTKNTNITPPMTNVPIPMFKNSTILFVIFFSLIVAFASLAGAPQVFASVDTVLDVNITSNTLTCTFTTTAQQYQRGVSVDDNTYGRVFGFSLPSCIGSPVNLNSVWSDLPSDTDIYFTVYPVSGVPPTGTPLGYFIAKKTSGVWSEVSVPTRIISVSPLNNSVVATTTSSGGATTTQIVGYVDSLDFVQDGTQVTAVYSNDTCNQVTGFAFQAVNGDCYQKFEYPLATSGSFTVGTSSVLFNHLGQWRYNVKIQNLDNSYCAFSFCIFNDTVDLASASGSFTVGTSTDYDRIQDFIQDLSGQVASTTNFASCSPLSFDTLGCVQVLFVPNSDQIDLFFNSYAGEFLKRFPLGYVTDTISILSTTTVGSLTVLDATLPSSLPGGGAHIELDLTGILDPILNATTSYFLNESATDSRTLYEITSEYWDKLIYLSLFIYIISRILGSHLISNPILPQNSSVNGSVPNETYRYKEKLYKMSLKGENYNRYFRDK